jgi:hypothetical protein
VENGKGQANGTGDESFTSTYTSGISFAWTAMIHIAIVLLDELVATSTVGDVFSKLL